MWYVYILKSIKYGKFYTGHTNNLTARLAQHNSGKTRSIKAFIPMKIVYTETYGTKQEAYKREFQIKSYKGGNAFKKLVGIYGEVA